MGRYAGSRSRLLPFETAVISTVAIKTSGLVVKWQQLRWRFLLLRWALGLLLAAVVAGFFAFLAIASPGG